MHVGVDSSTTSKWERESASRAQARGVKGMSVCAAGTFYVLVQLDDYVIPP